MESDDVSVGRELGIELDAVGTLFQSQAERRQCVLRGMIRGPAVSDHQRGLP